MPMGGVQDVQCAQLLPRVAQETHAARTHQGGIEFNSCVCTCISMCAVGVSEEFTFCCDCSTVWSVFKIWSESLLPKHSIRESVDSLCRDGADAQYMQYLSKSRITSPQIR